MPAAGASEGNVACTNLRSAPGRSGLDAVGSPRRVAPPGAVPLLLRRLADGTFRMLIVSDSTVVGTVDPDRDATYQELMRLPSPVGRTLTVNGGITLVTECGSRFTFTCDSASGIWSYGRFIRDFPPVVLRADDHAELTETVDAFTLTGSYPHCSEPVSAADKAAVTNRISDAVELLSVRATAVGRSIHPRLMSYRLLDAAGRCLHTSVPVWVGPQDGGFGLCSMLSASVSRQDGGKCAVAPVTVAATAFKPVVVVPKPISKEWAKEVASLEILASPELTQYDPAMTAGCRLRVVDQTTGRFEAYVPGTAAGMVPLADARARMVADMLERYDSVATVVATVPYPFGGGFGRDEGEACPLPLSAIPSAASAAAVARKALASAIPAVAGESDAALLAAAASPHSFTASVTLHAADMVAYGGLSVVRCRPPHAAVLAGAAVAAVAADDAPCHYVAVEFDDTSPDTPVTADLSPGSVPVAVGPVVVYPAPGASRLSVGVRGTSGATSRLALPLQASRSGRYSYYIAPDLKPVPLVADGAPLVVPADSRTPRRYPGVVAVARSSDPDTLLATATASSAEVLRIVPSVRSASSWDFARQHLLLFAADGICSLSVDARRRSMAVGKLWPVGVARPDAVAPAPHGIYAVLTDGSMVRVSGSRIYPVDGGDGAVAAVWCAPRGKLWTVDSDGSVTVLDPELHTAYSRTFGPVLSLHECCGRACALTADGLYDLAQEADGQPVKVGWAVRVPVPYGKRVAALSLDMQGASVDGTVALRADNGAGRAHSLPVTALRIRGQVNAPVRLRIAAPHRRYVTLSVDATVTPGTSLARWHLTLK